MLSVRALQKEDLPYLNRYWLQNEPEFLIGMGVDLDKLPSPEAFRQRLIHQINLPIPQKQSHCIIWLENEQPIGHSNCNQIVFGKSAFMHLHLWNPKDRQKGMGLQFLKMTIPRFFKDLQLQELFCEPYAHNPAPNKAIEKLGFTFVKRQVCVPGSLNFEQEVNRWRLGVKEAEELSWS